MNIERRRRWIEEEILKEVSLVRLERLHSLLSRLRRCPECRGIGSADEYSTHANGMIGYCSTCKGTRPSMNILAPGKWKINEQGALEPDDDKAKDYDKKGHNETEGQTFYCLYERAD